MRRAVFLGIGLQPIAGAHPSFGIRRQVDQVSRHSLSPASQPCRQFVASTPGNLPARRLLLPVILGHRIEKWQAIGGLRRESLHECPNLMGLFDATSRKIAVFWPNDLGRRVDSLAIPLAIAYERAPSQMLPTSSDPIVIPIVAGISTRKIECRGRALSDSPSRPSTAQRDFEADTGCRTGDQYAFVISRNMLHRFDPVIGEDVTATPRCVRRSRNARAVSVLRRGRDGNRRVLSDRRRSSGGHLNPFAERRFGAVGIRSKACMSVTFIGGGNHEP